MWWRAIVAGLVVAGVSQLADRYPRLGALLLTLPIVSIVAFIAVWHKEQELTTVSKLARETLVLVPLGLPFFIPIAFSERLGIGFWTSFIAGVALASATIGLWFWLGPQPTK
ncbi:hypothetical protein [Thalassoglobus polymorphus]|uniref:DUF3147 family protein n=1 Tax=Thalassoglobus polymorphus TaxID=2527994 RepID=A0A517QQM8_9PLAN|nr:hypothetical protein [Thalassoglobus polymorphus]QDT33934.1 hypothetical protein Mal48_31910 [Thalassoglobus polymorphus]